MIEARRVSARIAAASSLALVVGCAAAPPPASPAPAPPARQETVIAPEPPAKEPLETGSDCAKAEAQCDGGVCTLFIKNGCEQAVSCDATMVTTCKAGADMVEAARRKRETFASKTDGEIALQGSCPSGVILRTAVQRIACK